MKLKRLQLKGFKAFAERTEFEFHNGITTIVGPNGSGKSNLVDAFKWVLGEQSAKNLRGDQMLDVIFRGTDKRKPAGFAEVSLFFEETEDVITDGSPSLKLTRRLYRTGESQYLVDDNITRLKDIREIFAGTGIGHNAYSILEQDRINKILSANPDDRRLVFEEAAGVSKYRAKRNETERELLRTTQNLEVIAARMGELQRRERGVRIQAAKAKKYQEYAEQEKLLRSQLYIKRHQELSAKIKELNKSKEIQEQTVLDLETKASTLAAEVSGLEEEYMCLSEKISLLRQEKTGSEEKVKAREDRISYLSRLVSGLEEKKRALRDEYAKARERVEQAKNEENTLASELEACAVSVQTFENELKEIRLKVYEVSTYIQEYQDAVEEIRKKGSALLEKRTGLRNQVATYTENIEKWSVLTESLLTEQDVLKERIAGLTDSINSVCGKIEDTNTEIQKQLQCLAQEED
ncbi:MAG: AAA family ATPase, partial [Planctomycetota bacterium]